MKYLIIPHQMPPQVVEIDRRTKDGKNFLNDQHCCYSERDKKYVKDHIAGKRHQWEKLGKFLNVKW